MLIEMYVRELFKIVLNNALPGDTKASLGNRLTRLMNFVQSDIENETRISLADEGFAYRPSEVTNANIRRNRLFPLCRRP